MGSSNFTNRSAAAKENSPLSALRNLSTTCEVTNRIDIDKYFEVLKNECTKLDKVRYSPRPFKRSESASMIETGFSSSGRRKKNLRKRISCDESKLFLKSMSDKCKSTERKSSFNYDVSGQIVDKHGEDKQYPDHCAISRQKSYDLSSSKLKGTQSCCGENSGENSDLTVSYSEGDFKDFVNNNRMLQSKSCECISGLDERHREHAMIHGKIYSVSEQNRRLRKKYFAKKERKNSREQREQSIAYSADDLEVVFKRELTLS